jgi:hypothetical protein
VAVSAIAGAVSLFGLDPASYRPHPLHAPDQVFPESNCFTDVIVELVHAWGGEPLAMLGSALRLDFEGDQWTFFKPTNADLELLYGIDVHEMQPWRAIPTQVAEQLARGRSMIVELDSWHLPDTAGTAYRREHVKTACAMETIDLEGERLRYFHNGGYYELSGEDFRGIFRTKGAAPDVLPPYTELVRFDAGRALEGDELRAVARALVRGHLERAPRSNPFHRFGEHLGRELPVLAAGTEADYHAYAFATVRLAGSGFQYASAHVDWAFGDTAADVVRAFDRIVESCKVLVFKLARRRPFDHDPIVDDLAAAWDEALVRLVDLAP